MKVEDTSKNEAHEDEGEGDNDNALDDLEAHLDNEDENDDMDLDLDDTPVLSTEFKLTMENILKIIEVHAIGKRMLTTGRQCERFNN